MGKKIIFTSIVLIILGIVLYNLSLNDVNLKVKEIINITENDNCAFRICFQSLPNSITFVKRYAFFIQNGKVSKDKDTYTMGCFQNYPDKSFDILSKKLHYNSPDNMKDQLGQVYMYRNFEEYELYIMEGERRAGDLKFNIIFNKNNDPYILSIPHLPDERIDCIYKTNQYLYTFFKSSIDNNINMYKINSSDYTYENYKIDIEKYRSEISENSNRKILIEFDRIIVHNENVYILYRDLSNNIFKIISYDFLTQTCKIVKLNDIINIEYIFDNGSYIILLNSKQYSDENYIMSLLYLDYNLNTINHKEIDFSNHIKGYCASSLEHCYLYNNKIYGLLVKENYSYGSLPNYAVFIYDIVNDQFLYLSELLFSEKNCMMTDNTWMYNKDSNYYYMR